MSFVCLGLAVLVGMYANDPTRAAGMSNAEDQLADVVLEVVRAMRPLGVASHRLLSGQARLEQRRDALQQIVSRATQSTAVAAQPVAAAKRAPASDWRVCVTPEQEEYFYNPVTDETVWELPPGVQRDNLLAWDPDGALTARARFLGPHARVVGRRGGVDVGRRRRR